MPQLLPWPRLSLLELERRNTPALVVGLTAVDNLLVTFSTDTPDNVSAPVAVTGLQSGENLVGIAYRPLTDQLFGLGNTGRLYAINTTTEAATLVGSGNSAIALSGTRFGFTFDPLTDQIRVTSDTGQNFRLDPNTGAVIDGDLNTPGVQPDTALSPAGTAVANTAYVENFPGSTSIVTSTTLYGIDAATAQLVFIGGASGNPSPNGGAVTVIGSLGVPTTADASLDVAANGNVAYATLTANSASQLYTVNLSTGAATLVGSIGSSATALRDIAVQSRVVPLYATDETNLILLDNSASPGTVTSTMALTGLATGETLAGIDLRPSTGTLYGVAVNGTAARLVTIDPATGALTTVGNPFTLTTGATNVGVDFDPVADRLRVVSNVGDNLAIDPVTGAVTAGPNLSATGITGLAASNNFAGATATTLYGINSTTGDLVTINPATGAVTTVGPLGVTLTPAAPSEFDIAAGDGTAFAALDVSGTTGVYTIGLATGKATLVGNLKVGTTDVRGLTTGPSGRVSGTLFADINANGVHDNTEPSLVGATVQLARNGAVAFTTTTDANGNFVFTGVPDGTYTVQFTTVEGNATQTVTVTNAADVGGVNFALKGAGSISGTVFDDTNFNGVRDPGEAGRGGIPVNLDLNNDGTVDQTTTTDANGFY